MIDVENYSPMVCPVCGKFEFSELQETDLLFRDKIQCVVCGWVFDKKQQDNPDMENGLNELSLNQHRDWYHKKVAENPDFNFQEENYHAEAHLCPVCHVHQFPDRGSFDICPVCGWIDDAVMEKDPDQWAGCGNDLCLNDFKKRYQHLRQNNPDYKYKINEFNDK